MSQAPSATFPVSLNGGTPLLIPPKPLFQDFQFKVIGKEPALLMRLSNNMATHVDEFDIDDIYEEPPLHSSSNMASENVPSGSSRPTLFQTLAGDDELGANDGASMDVVNFSSLRASLQSIWAPDFPKLLPNTASPLSISTRTLSGPPGPAPQSTVCAAGSSTIFQDSEHPDRESRTHDTSSSSPNDAVPSPSDLKTVNSFKALKKVVVLKDKFRAVSATARQSQRLAKHALMNAQRSAAAAQSCLVAAESFVPCVSDVISAIRRMRPGSGACASALEWVAVLRDLEDDLYDLKQWSSLDTFALGQGLPHLRNVNPGGMARESSTGFPLTSVEEEAQEALRAWNQLDQQIHENDRPIDSGIPTRAPGSQIDGVAPESNINRAQRPGTENGAGISPRQEMKESGNQVSEELAEGPTENLEKDRGCCEQEKSQTGGRQSVEAEATIRPRVEVETVVPLEIMTEVAEAEDLRDDQMQDQQQTGQTCEERHHVPSSTVAISTAANSDIGNVTSKETLVDCPRPGSTSSPVIGHIQAISKPQENVLVAPSAPLDQDSRNLHASATPIAEDDTEQMPAPTSNHVSSDEVQAEQLPPSLTSTSALPDEVLVASQHGVGPADGTLPSQVNPSTPIPTTPRNSEVTCDDELGKSVILPSKITSESRTSDRLQDVSRMLPIKTEHMEPQLNLKVKENKAVDEPVASTESLAKAVEVKPAFSAPSKPGLERPVVSVPLHLSSNECKIGTRPPGRVSSVDLPVPLPNGLPAINQRPLPSIRLATSDSVEVTMKRTSPNNVAPPQPADTPVMSNSPVSPSSRGSQALTPQAASAEVHLPTSSAVPLALRVERTQYPNHMRDFDDSISPDLMSSRGWDADENDGSRRGSKRSPNRFEPVGRSRSRDVESRNQYVDNGSRSMTLPSRGHLSSLGSRLSKSPDGRRPMSSYDYPAPLIGKKRPRDEVNHPLPPRGRRDWTGTTFPMNQMPHVSHDFRDMGANKRSGLLTTPIAEPSYNSNNTSRHLAPSLIRRLDPSESTVGVANPLERRLQHQFPPQQPQNRVWQNNGYNVGHPSPYSGQNHHSYDNKPPQLLDRMTNSQQFQFQHDSGHSHPNVGRPSNRPHGRGRGFGGQGANFPQRFSRKPPSLYDRLDNKPY